MKTLTDEQAKLLVNLIGEDELFYLINNDGSCPGMFFGDACRPGSCPITEGDKEDNEDYCANCVRREIAKFKG